MTLEQLGEDYLRQAEVLRRRITELRPHLKGLRGKARKDLERRIYVLYDSAQQCKSTGLYLKYYYTGE